MEQQDFKIIFIKDSKSNTYTAWIPALSGIFVQVDKMEDAPSSLAKSFECLLKYGLKIGNFEVVDLTL